MNKHSRFTYTGLLSTPMLEQDERKAYIQSTNAYYEHTSSAYTTLPPQWSVPPLDITPFLSHTMYAQPHQSQQLHQSQQQLPLPPQQQIHLQPPMTRTRGRRVSNIPNHGIRTFACKTEDCGKVFKRSEHLKRHIKSIHTMEKPFKCPYQNCNKRFSRSDNLNQHIRIHRHCSNQQTSPTSSTSSTSSSPSVNTDSNSPLYPF